MSQFKLQALQKWLESNALPEAAPPRGSPEDEYYAEKLQQGISTRKKHLKQAKDVLIERHKEFDESPETLKKRLNGLLYANDRVPYNLERGDLIGASFATVKLHTQVKQSEKILEELRNEDLSLDTQIKEATERQWQLEEIVEALKERLAKEAEQDDDEDELMKWERIVKEEKVRYRQLKSYAKELRGD